MSQEIYDVAEEIEVLQEEEEMGHGSSGHVLADLPQEIKLRSMIVTGPVDEDMASVITRNLLTFAVEDPDAPVVMYVNTYGGSVHDLMAIYDVMQFIPCPVYTVGFGKVMSAGTLILAAGEKGHRYALPNTSIMLHKVKGGAGGDAEDIESSLEHIKNLQQTSNQLLSKHTKIKAKQMKVFMSGADSYVSAEEALALGIIDHVSGTMPRLFSS